MDGKWRNSAWNFIRLSNFITRWNKRRLELFLAVFQSLWGRQVTHITLRLKLDIFSLMQWGHQCWSHFSASHSPVSDNNDVELSRLSPFSHENFGRMFIDSRNGRRSRRQLANRLWNGILWGKLVALWVLNSTYYCAHFRSVKSVKKSLARTLCACGLNCKKVALEINPTFYCAMKFVIKIECWKNFLVDNRRIKDFFLRRAFYLSRKKLHEEKLSAWCWVDCYYADVIRRYF